MGARAPPACYNHALTCPREIRPVSVTPLEEVRNARLQKIAELRDLGIDPYPSQSSRTHYIGPIRSRFEQHLETRVTVAGRLMSWRKHGGLRFGDLQDQTGKLQLYIRRDHLAGTDAQTRSLGYADLRLVDIGDIVEVTGTPTRTERGEMSVLVDSLRLLAKSLRPLPEKWSGLKDRETILRKRYLDSIVDLAVRSRFELICRMLFAIRKYLDDRGFLEFHTPIIQPQYGGGTAKPFTTHVNALDVEMYLAISHELYLKRLIVAGFDKVYTIGRYFRNEGIDRTHHPEFSMVETMTAFENYQYNMDLIEGMFRHVATSVFGKTTFHVRGHEVDFAAPWRRVAMAEAVKEKLGIDFREVRTTAEAHQLLAQHRCAAEHPSVGDALAAAFEELVAPTLIQPTLVYGHPVEISPLAKPMAADPRYAERFEIFIGGMECGDNWSEQNDAVQLLSRWRAQFQEHHRYEGESEVPPLDYDFIEALEYGMAPTTGIGPGIERMAMILTEQENIDDVIFFPLMRPVTSQTNRTIYQIPHQPKPCGTPREMTLTHDGFERLLQEGLLQPEADTIVIQPHVCVWQWPLAQGRWSSTGHLEISGLLPGTTLRLAGYDEIGVDRPDILTECRKILDLAERSYAEPIRKRFPDRMVQVAEPVAVPDPRAVP